MAFALTSFFADGTKYQGPGLYRAQQNIVITATGLAADVDFDVGDYSGTFWTAALADATYGTLASQVKTALQKITAQCQCVAGTAYIAELDYDPDIIRGTTALVDVYVYNIDSTTLLPIYLFAANEGQLTYTLFVSYLLSPNMLPVNCSYNLG